jgi:5-formyltetrahydrofolate cyclo-ligase
MSIRKSKARLRGWALATRDALPADRRARDSARACAHLLEGAADPAVKLAAFAPIRSEADPTALYDRPHLAFPRVGPRGLELFWCTPDALVAVPPFGIREPTEDARPVDLTELDLIVVPGLVFDEGGGRIGYGKGYYDRLLAGARAASKHVRCVGFGFEAQLIDSVPCEPFDQRLDGLVTEAGLRWFSVEGSPDDR